MRHSGGGGCSARHVRLRVLSVGRFRVRRIGIKHHLLLERQRGGEQDGSEDLWAFRRLLLLSSFTGTRKVFLFGLRSLADGKSLSCARLNLLPSIDIVGAGGLGIGHEGRRGEVLIVIVYGERYVLIISGRIER